MEITIYVNIRLISPGKSLGLASMKSELDFSVYGGSGERVICLSRPSDLFEFTGSNLHRSFGSFAVHRTLTMDLFATVCRQKSTLIKSCCVIVGGVALLDSGSTKKIKCENSRNALRHGITRVFIICINVNEYFID